MTTKIHSGSQEMGRRIREARLARKMSQPELAEKASLSVSQISQIELGKNDPKVQTLIRILEALQVPADQILRADIPAVNALGQGEYSELLGDCTPEEIETLLSITRQIKAAIRKNQSSE